MKSAYLDVKIVNGASARCACAVDGVRAGGRTLERGDAVVQACDLSLLLFELRALFFDFSVRDRLRESAIGEFRKVCERLDILECQWTLARSSSGHIDTALWRRDRRWRSGLRVPSSSYSRGLQCLELETIGRL